MQALTAEWRFPGSENAECGIPRKCFQGHGYEVVREDGILERPAFIADSAGDVSSAKKEIGCSSSLPVKRSYKEALVENPSSITPYAQIPVVRGARTRRRVLD